MKSVYQRYGTVNLFAALEICHRRHPRQDDTDQEALTFGRHG